MRSKFCENKDCDGEGFPKHMFTSVIHNELILQCRDCGWTESVHINKFVKDTLIMMEFFSKTLPQKSAP